MAGFRTRRQIVSAAGSKIADAKAVSFELESTDGKEYLQLDTAQEQVVLKQRTVINVDSSGTPDDLGDFDNYALVLQGSSSDNDETALLLSSSVDVYGGSAIVHKDTGAGGKGELNFYTKQTDAQEPPTKVMTLTDSGNVTINGPVGIRESAVENHWSGARDLVVKGLNNAGITLRTTASSYSSSFAAADADGTSAEGVGGMLQYVHNGDYWRFYSKWAGSGEHLMRINEYGVQKHRYSLAQDSTARDDDTDTDRPAYLADSGATLILDYEFGTVAEVTLTANVTAIKIFNAPPHGSSQTMTVKIKQHSTAVTLSYSSVTIYSNSGSTSKAGNLLWSGGAEHVLSTGNNQIDIVQFTCMPHGDTNRDIYASIIGQNFS